MADDIPDLQEWKEDMQRRRRGFRPGYSPNLEQAKRDLKLTPQEIYLYQHHLANSAKGGVANPDNSISTLYQMTQEANGRQYNLPTVWDAQILSPQESFKRAQAIGLDKFPSYDTEEEADKRYSYMHEYLGRDMSGWFDSGEKPVYPPFRYGVGPGNQMGE